MFHPIKHAARWALGASLTLTTLLASAQTTFPSKPITVIVPIAAGSSSDTTARVIGKALEQELKQVVLIDNRPGGTGTVGAELAAKAPADGHTLFFLGGGSLSQTFFSRKLNFDLLQDFAPVAQVSRGDMFVIVRSDLPVKNMQELGELLRKNPDKHNYGYVVNTQMMPMEMFKDRAKFQINGVPFKTGGQVQQAFDSGDITAFVGTSAGMEALFSAGKIRFLTVLGDTRNPYSPDIPTSVEAGLGDVRAPYTQAFWVPAKTPPEIIAKLNTAINAAIKHPEVVEFAKRSSIILTGGAPRVQFDAIKAEHAYWAEAARVAKFQPE